MSWLPALLATSAGCALIGYDFSGYGPANANSATGAGGAGAGGESSASPSGAGGAGAGGESSASASSSGSGMEEPCQDASQCDDQNACTTDSCDTAANRCVHEELPVVSDNEPCTKDDCDRATGAPTHTPDPKCCNHSLCTTGAPINEGCTFFYVPPVLNCVADICGSFPSCCTTQWNQTCADQAKANCLPGGLDATCMCEHSYCQEGTALTATCDPCVHAICTTRKECCEPSHGWDKDCVALTDLFCHVPPGAECQ